MATLTYTITATAAEFDNFADRLGYMPTVSLNGEYSPNPESRQQFITRIMKESQDRLFFMPFVTEIEQQVINTREAEKETMRDAIRSRSTINYIQ